ncbi:carboxypeptidase-like protein [Mucilaginibacter gracilis]|uniref:Carboxypeptidase-like protein n=1 Tax=Mucilaginibacter gracilis TaxID=423350 RepID=A0A495JA39_9SPHI|nr:DUF5686 family protein [Mucilaginibacter gracilis]RKR85348.1 carboxypeptidase-like protein [Mucilaginibacter gracilis]
MIKSLIVFFAVILAKPVFGQSVLAGRVTDSQGNAAAFTSVYINGTTQGTSANPNGYYSLKLKPGKYVINYRFVGFKQQTDEVEVTGNYNTHNVTLVYEDYQPKQNTPPVTEDAAFDIIRNAIKKRDYYLKEINAYSCDVYIRGTQKLISAPKGMLSRGVARQLQLNLSAKSILYMSESASHFNFEQPGNYKEVMVSSKATGNYNAFNFDRAANLQVNFYKNMLDIEGLNQRGFISPIADDALKYYTYKLLGSTTENGKVVNKIQVTPIDDREPVFKGNIYIVENDWRIYAAHLYVTGKSNLNFVDTLNINQQYLPVSADKWQPSSVSFTYSGNVLGFRYNGYILGTFSNYNLDTKFPPHFFNGETMRIADITVKRDSVYWSQNRPVPLTFDEQRIYNLKDSLVAAHSKPAYLDSAERANNKFSPLSYVFFGDTVKHRHKNEVITVNPLYDVVQYNPIEGWVVDLKPTYTKSMDVGKAYTISPELRYGFDNKIVSLNTGFNYRYDPEHEGAFYGKVGTGILDLNNEGTVGPFLNSFNALYFKSNDLKLYRSKFLMAGTQREVARGLLLDGNLEYARRTALQNQSSRTVRSFPDKEFNSNNPFITAVNAPLLFEENDALTLKLSGTYTFDEEYTTTPGGRVYDQSKYPKIKVNYRKGIKGIFSSDVDYDYADVQIYHDHINLGIYGFSAFQVTAGNFFNSNALSYPDYKWFKGNQGITFTPGISQFHFLPYYTYSQSSFLEAHYEHNFAGYLFNNIAGLRKLKLEEIIGGNFLTQKNTPNYGEIYVGVQRFFFRIDYGFVYRRGHIDQGIKLYFGI